MRNKFTTKFYTPVSLIGHFTVVYLVAKPLIWSEAEGDQYLVSIITK